MPGPHSPRGVLDRQRWGLLLGVYWAILFTATHVPLPAHDLPRHSDKTVHLAGYAVLAILWTLWRSSGGRVGWRQDVQCLAVIGLYAVLDELLQFPVGRTPDILDVGADVLGAVGGVAVVSIVARCRSAGRLSVDE